MRRTALSLTAGFAAVGALVGWFTGQSGFSSDVLAALLPAILAVIGSGTILWSLYSDNESNKSLSGILMLAFSISIYMGSVVGSNFKREETSIVQQLNEIPGIEQLKEARLKARAQYLMKCADQEAKINNYRVKFLALEALPSKAICP